MELDDVHKGILEQLELAIRQGSTPDRAADKLVKIGLDRTVVSSVLEFRKQIAATHRTRVVDRAEALYDPEFVDEPWYTGVQDHDVFWPRLKAHLQSQASWAPAVPSLDDSSADVLSLLQDPHRPRIDTRGLVVGYVQSGKTANFTATIAKAADVGYRLFIVLSGVHNALRRQTQIRLTEQLHDLEPTRWLGLTSAERDFGNPVKALALVAGTSLRLLAVVKKNSSRLRKLRDWLKLAQDQGGFDTCPVLIIDDEADQASPNASPNALEEQTTVNRLVRDILRLPRVAYVGYTATPFANVLIDPKSPHDLYPRHFIYSLRKPVGYFGSEELFGLGRSEEEQEADGYDVVRFVPPSEADLHRIKKGSPAEPKLTASLADSVSWFVLATAARRVRSDKPQHSSMLIHTTVNVAAHFKYAPLIKEHLGRLKKRLQEGDTAELREFWNEECAREPAVSHDLPPVSFEQLVPCLGAVLDDVAVVVDNGSSPERLLYDETAATTVVAIGGNTLSRGLTLEGLVSSFFLRGASTYDTLLQMGRWFGYRRGYEDLPRIWTTGQLVSDFRFLASVEQGIRADIARYAVGQTRPTDVAVRIQLDPRLQVTSRLKMQFAVPASLSFSGQRPQTITFAHRDTKVVDKNRDAARDLCRRAIGDGLKVERAVEHPEHWVIRDVAANHILAFVKTYRFHERSEMSANLLASYIEKQVSHGELLEWNVAIIARAAPKKGTIDLGLGAAIPLIERSRLRDLSEDGEANIGTLMSKPDRVADLMAPVETKGLKDAELLRRRTESGRALLLLYPIAMDSEPRDVKSKQVRESLDAVGHLIGVAVSFPIAPKETDPASTVAVDLGRIEPDLDDEEASDLPADEDGDQNDIDLDGNA